MEQRDRDAIAAICLLAASADGGSDDRERDRIKNIAKMLGSKGGVSPDVYERVTLGSADVDAEARAITSPELRNLAYEMAVAVCDADGVSSPAERAFLDKLAAGLKLRAADAKSFANDADALADQPLDSPTPALAGIMAATAGTAGGALAAPAPASSARAAPNDTELDSMILNYAILNGALELLPQSLATMAIIPLQTKMVYRIGKKYGFTLDRGSIKDFLATVGVGATSQVVESFARRMVGGVLESFAPRVLGKGMGRTVANLGTKATGAAFGFGSTYALGHAAKQYYAGGRKLSAVDLKTLFTENTKGAQGLYQKYAPQIEAQAQKLGPSQIMSLVRGV
jgi:uncharacterized protein (DUF697 family)/uncharacterized tellurite resistance protein B-like protein